MRSFVSKKYIPTNLKRLVAISVASILIGSLTVIAPARSFAFTSAEYKDAEYKKAGLKRAKELYRKKDFQGAIDIWEDLLKRDPDDGMLIKYINQAKKRRGEAPVSPKDMLNISITDKTEVPTLSVNDCVAIAVQNSIQLRVAVKNVRLGEMRVYEARRNMLPTLKLHYEEYTGEINGRKYNGRKQYIEGQQPVFHGGELYFSAKQAEINLKVVRADCDRIKNELKLGVKKAYYSLAKARENLKIQRELKNDVDLIYKSVCKQYDQGLIAKIDYLNVSSQECQVRFQHVSAEGDVAVADMMLKQAMFLDPTREFSIMPLPEFRMVAVNYEKVLKDAMRNRPEILINELMFMYYQAAKKAASAKGWPKIDLLGNWGLAKENYTPADFDYDYGGDSFDKLSQQWYAGIKASMPLWGSTIEYSYTREQWTPVVSAYQGTEATTNGVSLNILDNMKYYSDKHQADVDIDRAAQELEKIQQEITLEVREGCFGYEKSLLQLETSKLKAEYQSKDLEYVQLRRGLDELKDSDVIESMIKLAQERYGRVQADAECFTSIASLTKAVGVEDYFEINNTGNVRK